MTCLEVRERLAVLHSAIAVLETQVRRDQHECFASLIDLHAERMHYERRLGMFDQSPPPRPHSTWGASR